MILKSEDIDMHKNNTNDSNGKDGTDVNVVDMISIINRAPKVFTFGTCH